ncbi:MAG: hypothetical protein ACE366_03085 [Bradymonadia bacterium]
MTRPARMPLSLLRVALVCAPLCLMGCDDDETSDQNTGGGAGGEAGAGGSPEGGAGGGEPAMCMPDDTVRRPRAQPIEFVGLSITTPMSTEEIVDVLSGVYGEDAQAGRLHDGLALQSGLSLTVEADERTAGQVIIRLDMTAPKTGNGPTERTIFRAPASLEYGEIFIATVQAALARAHEVYAADPVDAETFFLEHRVHSVNGGSLILRVDYDPATDQSSFTVKTETPPTSLLSGKVNAPAFTGDPYETIGGTVFFELARDQFDFFVGRAYGVSAGANQNFSDFYLLPHNWLRLTVTPMLEDELVDVAFDVVTLDGSRVPFARAPASFLAGEQFEQNVLRMVDNMMAQEELMPGSSTRWTVPFHYDDPDGGGLVKVIATGEKGVFRIAYAVDAPNNYLRPVDFLGYQGELDLPDTLEAPETSCADLGSEDAAQGQFRVTFDASTTIRNNENLDGPLRGNIYGSVFKAEDVRGTGPIEGARSVASFQFEDVDLTDPDDLQAFELPERLLAGEYQILGFIDIDGNADLDDPDPDSGDPVTVPIGSYPLECAVQPVTVEFAIPRP